MRILSAVFILGFLSVAHADENTIQLKLGFVQKIPCTGKLFISAVGNDNLVRLEALPKELGCAVILKPTGLLGKTNLILETSTGTVIRALEVIR